MPLYLHGGITDQQKAAVRRRADARVLRESGHWRGAMYVLGYAVECQLKARLMEMYQVRTLERLEAVLSKRFKETVDLRTHSIESLLAFTGARERLIGPDGNDSNLRAFHECRRWTVSWRYSPSAGTAEECECFFRAVERFQRFVATTI